MIAYPDNEAKRLNHVVSELPINADGPWDGITERLPKQVSRHLFPKKPERKTRRLLDKLVKDYVEEFLPHSPKQSSMPPLIEARSEERQSVFSTSASGPRSTKYMPESRHRQDSVSSPPVFPGHAYSGDPSGVFSTSQNQNHERKLQPPSLNRGSGSFRRRSSPSADPYRRSVGEIARANSPAPLTSPTDREEAQQQYVPTRADYTPKSSVSSLDRDRATPRRVAVVQQGVVHPGPTWDEYLSGRQTVARRHKTSL